MDKRTVQLLRGKVVKLIWYRNKPAFDELRAVRAAPASEPGLAPLARYTKPAAKVWLPKPIADRDCMPAHDAPRKRPKISLSFLHKLP